MADKVPIHRSGEMQIKDNATLIYAMALEDIKRNQTGKIQMRVNRYAGDVTTEAKADEDVDKGQWSWFLFDTPEIDSSTWHE